MQYRMPEAVQTSQQRGRMKSRNPHIRRKYMWAYLFILPQAIIFFVISFYPIIMSYVYSFFNWTGIGPLEDFIGFGNYERLFRNSQFWHDFLHTLIYTAGHTIVVIPVALILALILNNPKFKGKGFYRTLYFIPVITTTAIVGIIMESIFGTDDGLVNGVLQALGITHQSIPWLNKPALAMAILIVVGSWKFIGTVMIYWLAGLQSISNDLYEAAQLDGAGYWKTLYYVTLPLLKPVSAVILLLTIVNSMHVFDLVKTLTGGGPYYATETLDLFIYRYAFDSTNGVPQTGYASAAGVVLGLSIFVLSLVLGWLVKAAAQNKEKRHKKGKEGANL